MDFDLSEDQRTIKSTAREFLAARYPLAEVRRLSLEEERGFTDAQWDEVDGLGWPSLASPDEGLGTVALAVVAEELGYACAPSPLQSTWAATALLGETVAGRGAVALIDGATPVREANGALTGQKLAVPDAAWADVLLVAAGERVFSVSPGDVSIEPSSSVDPSRRLFTVTLDDAPAEALPGPFDHAWRLLEVATAAESVGIAERAMEMSVAYAKERRQFGRPIGTYQAVSHRCAQMLLEVEGARSVVYWAAWALDHAPEEAAVAVSAAKAYASDCGARVTGSAIQVHGGIGFTWEHDLQFLFKRATANAYHHGSAREHRGRVADAILA